MDTTDHAAEAVVWLTEADARDTAGEYEGARTAAAIALGHATLAVAAASYFTGGNR